MPNLWTTASDATLRGLAHAHAGQSRGPLPLCTGAGPASVPRPVPNVTTEWKAREDLLAPATAQGAVPGGIRPRALAAPAVANQRRYPISATATAAVSPSARSGAATARGKHRTPHATAPAAVSPRGGAATARGEHQTPHASSTVRAFITAALSCAVLPVALLPPQHAREIGWPIPEGFTFPHFRCVALYEHHGCFREAWALRGRLSCSVADRGTALPPSASCYHFRMKVEQFISVYPYPIHLQTNHVTCTHAAWANRAKWPSAITSGALLGTCEEFLRALLSTRRHKQPRDSSRA